MSKQNANNIFTSLYANRFSVTKNDATIINLSLLFSIIAFLTAPWLVIGGVIAALAMGYKIRYVPNAAGFGESLDTVVQEAKGNVRSVMDAVTERQNA